MQAADVFSGSGAGVFTTTGGRRRHFLKRAGVILLLLHLAAAAGLALDIITTDGKFYQGCAITQVEPDALRITHSNGAARIPYDNLPAALQKQYFDPAKVAAYRQQLEEARRVAAAKAEEERRQLKIAAAKAEEQREQEQAARQREEAARQQAEDEKKADAAREEQLRQLVRHKKAMFAVGLLAVGAALSIFIYFLPSIVGRHKTNAVAIFMLNLFLGWTFLGWIVALVWACTEDSAMERLARERMNTPPPGPSPRQYRRDDAPQLDNGRYLE
jgi:hypothetical protein